VRDVSRKFTTLRTATARAELTAAPATLARLRAGDLPKGDPLPVARVAAVQAVKDTSRLIPYCHPLPIEHVEVGFDVGEDRITVDVAVKAIARTGVEMEALTGASVAVLTLYDMMKMVDDRMRIAGVELVRKRGGKSDFREDGRAAALRAAVLVASDSVAAGEKEDASGRLIVERLAAAGVQVADYRVVPDEGADIAAAVRGWADDDGLDLVVTTGGTGFGPRDGTPEAMDGVIEREAPGVAETLRAFGQDRTPYSMLSRGRAGIRGRTLIVNLPGSRGGVGDALDALLPAVFHAYKMLHGGGHPADGDRKDGR
jgi:cyclic pyranopterin phosphate synthase